MARKSKIVGIGAYLPDTIKSNDDLAAVLDTSDAWIKERSGIAQRHLASEGELTSDLAVVAARNALANAKLTPQDIDLIICATTTPDNTFPATAVYVQEKLASNDV